MKHTTDIGWAGDRWAHEEADEDRRLIYHNPTVSYLSIPVVSGRRSDSD